MSPLSEHIKYPIPPPTPEPPTPTKQKPIEVESDNWYTVYETSWNKKNEQKHNG